MEDPDPNPITDYLRAKLLDDVQALIDDPHGVLAGMKDIDMSWHLTVLSRVADEVGTTLEDVLVELQATAFEMQRIEEVLKKGEKAQQVLLLKLQAHVEEMQAQEKKKKS